MTETTQEMITGFLEPPAASNNSEKKPSKKRKWYIKYQSMPKYQSRGGSQNGIVEIARPKKSNLPPVDYSFLDQAFAAYRRHKSNQQQRSPQQRPLNEMKNLKDSIELIHKSTVSLESKNNSSVSLESVNKENVQVTHKAEISIETTSNEINTDFNKISESPNQRKMSKTGKVQQLRFMEVVEVKEIDKTLENP